MIMINVPTVVAAAAIVTMISHWSLKMFFLGGRGGGLLCNCLSCFTTVKITFTCNITIAVVDDFYLKLIQDERGDAGKINENSTTTTDLSHECMKAKSSPKVCKLTTSMYLHCQLCQVGWHKSAELPELCCHSNASLLSDSTWGAEVNNLLLAFEVVGGRTDDRMM